MSAGPIPFETFPVLSAVPGIRHAFSLRTAHDTRADDFAGQFARQLGYDHFAGAEQPHSNAVAVVSPLSAEASAKADSSLLIHNSYFPAVDALVTRQRNLPLIIRCADCAPVYIIDKRTPAIALIHSGKKGTLTNVVGNTLATLNRELRTSPTDCVAFIGPSIGPCHYEIDLWSGIEAQLRTAGIGEIHSPRICTACHLNRYYSYRAEKGQTGRMFAVLALNPL